MTGGAPTPGTRAYLQTTEVSVLQKPFTVVQLKSAMAQVAERAADVDTEDSRPVPLAD